MGAARGSGADVVVLAAGRSSRLGEPKGLVLVEGKPWIFHQLDAIGSRRVVVVLGHDRDRYLASVPQLAARARIVTNPDPDRGPFSSLQVGLAEVTPGANAFVLPVDVPAAGEPVWAALEAALAARAPGEAALAARAPGEAALAALPEYQGGQSDQGGRGGRGGGGHPVLLAAPLAAEILRLPPSSRLDEVLRRPATLASVLRIPVADPRVRLNLNTAEDWGKVRVGG
ncbi:MAG TPA: NTP transferase domain-containing protein [Polyangiaceae bacterium]|jgi:molybdenum cofactor cytidylyltransferase